eukprot:1886086-Heterocapsa_arctica.AAC.1
MTCARVDDRSSFVACERDHETLGRNCSLIYEYLNYGNQRTWQWKTAAYNARCSLLGRKTTPPTDA